MDDRPRLSPRSEVRDGMRIDWDVPITMDDGLCCAPTCSGQ